MVDREGDRLREAQDIDKSRVMVSLASGQNGINGWVFWGPLKVLIDIMRGRGRRDDD